MDIEKAFTLKKELELTILASIQEYTLKTGLCVDSVNFKVIDVTDASSSLEKSEYLYDVRLTVKF